MEFKTIVYILVAAFWLLSRFFQKVKQDQEPGRVKRQSPPIPDSPPRTERRIQTRPMAQRRPLSVKPEGGTAREFLPSAVSLENPVATPTQKTTKMPPEMVPEQPAGAVSPSDVELLADEIRNGRMDWRRAVIINELISKRSGL